VIVRSVDRPELDEALGSIARQTYPNIETVVVNAKGSGHRPLSDRCGRFPLRVVGTGEPLTRSRAANLGLDSAHGTYLGFLDDDDWLEGEHVEVLAAALGTTAYVELAYSGVRSILPEGGQGLEFNRPFDPAALRAGNTIPIHAALFRRRAVEDGCRFDESLDVFEDWDFWLQLSARGPFAHVDRVTAVYRLGGTSRAGLEADEATTRQGRARVYEKWRLRWSGTEVTAMVEVLNEKIRARELKIGKLRAEAAGAKAETEAAREQIVVLERTLRDPILAPIVRLVRRVRRRRLSRPS
jgi:glycosyltransferase involved in cell wall biosynthesis